MSTFQERALQFYRSQGLPPHQAAAMVAHAIAESGGDPTIKERLPGGKTGPGYGTFQWTTPSRKKGLYDFAAQNHLDPDAEETQLRYSLHELRTSEKAAGDKLFNAKTFKEAVDAGMHYLRPSGYTPDNPSGGHNYAGRYNVGAKLLGEAAYAGDTTAPAPTPAFPNMPVMPPSAGLLAQQSEEASPERKAEAASRGMIDQGLGLLGQAETPAPQIAALAPMRRPQVQAPGNPNFLQMLAQQRLQRRMV
jgi:hypothetical protein